MQNMIEIKVEGKRSEIRVQGDSLSVAAELGFAICRIYSALHLQNAEAAAEFKDVTKIALRDESPVWKPDLNTNGVVMVWPKKE